ncbi:hypothetical protein RCH07_003161 [Arthrobacter sp. CG_A4]|nr:hypothetical protein [Arthrobacter sp. CG_A4]
MELSASERRAVTKAIAPRYARSDRAAKKQVLDELCATTGWYRDHARKALRMALVPKVARPRAPRPVLYGESVIEALRFCWAVEGTPCGRLLAAALPDLVPRLRRFKELRIDAGTAALLLKIAPATIDRRLRADRAKMDPRGRSHTKPGTLLKDSIPMRTWTDVVGVFPSPAALLRLAGAVLVEQHDEWEAGDRRYLSEASMAVLTAINTAPAEPVEEAILLPELTAA